MASAAPAPPAAAAAAAAPRVLTEEAQVSSTARVNSICAQIYKLARPVLDLPAHVALKDAFLDKAGIDEAAYLLDQEKSNELIGSSESDVAAGLDFADEVAHKALRDIAHASGPLMLVKWMKARYDHIVALLGTVPEPSATAFNDLYKWTMLPVLRKFESYFPPAIVVTFGVDIRDAADKVTMLDVGFQARLSAALQIFADRLFDEDRFKAIYRSGPRFSALEEPAAVASICKQGGAARSLAQYVNPTEGSAKNNMFTVADFEALKESDEYRLAHERAMSERAVTILYYKNTAKNLVFVEAVGPCHRVTWLETSMMQTIYETLLHFQLNTDVALTEWIAGALIRCAKGVAFARAIKTPFSALFTNRRTGSYEFLLLQNFFFADHFKFGPPTGPLKIPNSSDDEEASKTLSLGSSTVDTWIDLGTPITILDGSTINLPRLPPAGTHAHELSMISSILFPELDEKLPGISQVIGHYLYYVLVWLRQDEGTRGPLPMLPDTLGTRLFLHAASKLIINPENKTLLDFIRSARQDSGGLSDFKEYLRQVGYLCKPAAPMPPGMMASEVDTTKTYFLARKLEYGAAGIGGFFGDSIKVWGTYNGRTGSQAVKAVEVRYITPAGKPASAIVYIHRDGALTIGYPVKIGDPKSAASPAMNPATDKLSLTRNLDTTKMDEIQAYVSKLRELAATPFVPTPAQLSTYFTPEGGAQNVSALPQHPFVVQALAAAVAVAAPAVGGFRNRRNRTRSRARRQTQKKQNQNQKQQRKQKQSRRQQQKQTRSRRQ